MGDHEDLCNESADALAAAHDHIETLTAEVERLQKSHQYTCQKHAPDDTELPSGCPWCEVERLRMLLLHRGSARVVGRDDDDR